MARLFWRGAKGLSVNRGWRGVALNVEVLKGGGDILHLSLKLGDCITVKKMSKRSGHGTDYCNLAITIDPYEVLLDESQVLVDESLVIEKTEPSFAC
ncbi:hypothetical protein DY000_02004707 [Brassica cretica]|uniref:Uncharacterized protein n=1 Tax=Brassica cretica TaxID=69181 RepID=A0ABQ7CBG6_BRACR|nr:hypothetical protein DY000_02004707 [Brassica cretica]